MAKKKACYKPLNANIRKRLKKNQERLEELNEGEYGLGSWLGDNVGNIAQTVGGTALMFVPGGQPIGAGMLVGGASGFAKDAIGNKNEKDLNAQNTKALIGQNRLAQHTNQQMIPTFAAGGMLAGAGNMNAYGYNLMAKGGHLPEGKATLKEAKEFLKLYPDEMKSGTEVEYEHTGNKKLAERIAADHIKDHLTMTGGDPGYYKRLQAAGISDELNKMPQVMAEGGPLTAPIKRPLTDKEFMNKIVQYGYHDNLDSLKVMTPEQRQSLIPPGSPLGYEKVLKGTQNTGGFKYYDTEKPINKTKPLNTTYGTYAGGGYFGPAGSISGGIGDVPSFNDKQIVTQYSGGGTHQQNPNGGIPIGKAKVEEGEVRVDFDNGSYIFSNRY
jgi:hypothetical protein